MSIAVNMWSKYRSKRVPSEAMAAFRHMVLSALERSWPQDRILRVSMLQSNLGGPARVLLHAAIYELRETGLIDFAYCEGWSVGVRLTTKDLAGPDLAYSRNSGGR